MTSHVERVAAQENRRRPKAGRRRGSEVIEFTLVMLPLLAFVFLIVDIAWAVFAKSTLQHSVRVAARYAVVGLFDTGKCQTESIKARVQQNALGLLSGTSGTSKIKVHYFKPDPSNPAAEPVEVSDQPDGNAGGNIVLVAVEGFSVVPLLPRLLGPKYSVDNSPLAFTVRSADRIEPVRTPPCIGVAP